MKIAILGKNPVALETALRFHSHGASITWFNFDEDLLSHFDIDLNWAEATSELGQKLLGKNFKSLSYQDWLNDYYSPLITLLKEQDQRIKPYEVVSIAKRHLAPGETIPGKSRFHDLFRLIFEIDPKDFINEQKDTDPELYQRLNQEVVNSLQSRIEMYDDVDVVIDCRYPTFPLSMNISGRALGEKRIQPTDLFRGLEALKKSREDISKLREVALVGHGDMTAQVILNLADWFQDPRMRLFLISHEESPLQSFLLEAKDEVKERVLKFFSDAEAEFKKMTDEFMVKLREWQALDDFVQVKIPRPTEPIPRLVYFMAHNATAIDQLIDNKRLFLTLETSDFRTSKAQPENNLLELKTIGADKVFVSNGFKDPENCLDDNEVGFFRIRPASLLVKNNWNKDIGELNGIEEAIFKLFSPAESH